MAKRKEKNVEVVITNVPLEPTTIGVMESKESGPVFAIVWILIFIVGIVCLPYITTWIHEGNPPIIFEPSKDPKPENPTVPIEEPDKLEYYALDNTLNIKLEGFEFQYFAIDNNTLEFRITNQSGKSTFFLNNNYYLELYTKDKLLLQRLKITREEVITVSNLSYDISNALQNGEVALVALVKKEVKDYPPVTLVDNALGNPVLICTKDSQTLTYEFAREEEKNYLVKITNSTTYNESTTENYDMMLQDMTTLNGVYNGISGIESELIPIRGGFRFNTTIDLKNILTNNLNRYFTDSIYYAKDTEAKTISFELNSSGYDCK